MVKIELGSPVFSSLSRLIFLFCDGADIVKSGIEPLCLTILTPLRRGGVFFLCFEHLLTRWKFLLFLCVALLEKALMTVGLTDPNCELFVSRGVFVSAHDATFPIPLEHA